MRIEEDSAAWERREVGEMSLTWPSKDDHAFHVQIARIGEGYGLAVAAGNGGDVDGLEAGLSAGERDAAEEQDLEFVWGSALGHPDGNTPPGSASDTSVPKAGGGLFDTAASLAVDSGAVVERHGSSSNGDGGSLGDISKGDGLTVSVAHSNSNSCSSWLSAVSR
jgi:hypothetical protein